MKKRSLFLLFIIISAIFPVFPQNSAQSLIKEGVTLHDKKEYKEAIKKFEEALQINPKSISAIYEMSFSYLQLKDYKNASKYSTQVINSKDTTLSAGAYCVKSEALAEMGKINEAINLLQEGIKENKDNYLLHFNLALNYYKKNDIKNTLVHIKKSINLSKTNSGAFLLNSYALNDIGLWVQSIYSAQMFLLLEPDSQRAKNEFEEMLQTMRIKAKTETPVERSFIQQQLYKNKKQSSSSNDIPPLNTKQGVNRTIIYNTIKNTLDSLKHTNQPEDLYISFKQVNKAILSVLTKENNNIKNKNIFWSFFVPFFTKISKSEYYDTYCRYISVSYFPESMEWWNNNKEQAQRFLNWFEYGDKKPYKK